MPYQSDPTTRAKINAGPHGLPRHAPLARRADGLGRLLRAARRRTGRGRRHHRRRRADPVVLGRQQQDLDRSGRPGHPRGQLLAARELEGMHDIYYGTALPPDRKPMPILRPATGSACPTCAARRRRSSPSSRPMLPDRNTPFKPADADSRADRRPRAGFPCARGEARPAAAELLPIQSGVGNIANAVLAGLDDGPFRPLTAYTEVIQDGMLAAAALRHVVLASATAFSLSEDGRPTFAAKSTTTAAGSCCARRRSATIPRSSAGSAARDERDDRSRHLRQHQLHPRHGLQHPERHRRLRRLRAQRLHLDLPHALRPQRAARSPASCRWSATSITPSTTCKSSSPSRASPTCAACRRAAARSTSSTTARIPTTGPRCRTISTGPGHLRRQAHAALLGEALSWHVRYLRDGTMKPA